MRLIDADALILNLSDYQLQEAPAWGANGYGNQDKYEAITDCIQAVEDAPTIEPERKAGRKIVRSNGMVHYYACDQCDEPVNLEDNYCPNCGCRYER